VPFQLRLARSGRRVISAYAAGLLTAAWLVPVMATILTMTAQVAPWLSQGAPSIVLGLGGAGALWTLLGVVALPLALPRYVNPRSWSTIQSRIAAIDARVTAMAPSSAGWYGEATRGLAHLKLAQADTWPALRWATRDGYIDLWNRIHHAEEALIEAGDVDLLHVLDHTRLRLENAVNVSPRLGPLLDDVAGWLVWYGSRRSTRTIGRLLHRAVRGRHAGRAVFLSPPSVLPISSDSQAYARLRLVTAAINAFGEKNWAGLIRLRNQSVSALLLCESVAYGLLVLAIAQAVAYRTLIAAIVYFLAAAAVGLLNHLIQLRSWSSAVEDYGLQEARLKLLPAVSGLAGVAGVMLVAILTAGVTSLTNWDKVFSLTHNPFGLVVAALFGLAPSLLVRRLYDLAVRYESAIRSMQQVPQVDPRDEALRQ